MAVPLAETDFAITALEGLVSMSAVYITCTLRSAMLGSGCSLAKTSLVPVGFSANPDRASPKNPNGQVDIRVGDELSERRRVGNQVDQRDLQSVLDAMQEVAVRLGRIVPWRSDGELTWSPYRTATCVDPGWCLVRGPRCLTSGVAATLCNVRPLAVRRFGIEKNFATKVQRSPSAIAG